MSRICKKCGREIPLSAFYSTGKGRVDSTCKDCRKERARARYNELCKDDEYMEKERARGREKYRRLYAGTKTEAKAIKEKKYPSLRSARKSFHVTLSRDFELHHWNYNLTDCVLVLEKRLHRRLHQSITLNMDKGIYYRGDEKLDTIDKHMQVVQDVCSEYGFKPENIKVLRKE
jgi:hypothetical protein